MLKEPTDNPNHQKRKRGLKQRNQAADAESLCVSREAKRSGAGAHVGAKAQTPSAALMGVTVARTTCRQSNKLTAQRRQDAERVS